MPAPKTLRIPPRLLVLDAIGTLLLAFGFTEQFSSLSVWPTELQFPGDGIAIMIAGALMIAPLVTHVVTQVARGADARRQETADQR